MVKQKICKGKKTFQHLQWCFWHGDVQMELLTHCFNTVIFYQFLTVGDEEGKKGADDSTSLRWYTTVTLYFPARPSVCACCSKLAVD